MNDPPQTPEDGEILQEIRRKFHVEATYMASRSFISLSDLSSLA